MVPALLAFLFGTWLGVRFRFPVLVPAIMVTVGAAGAVSLAAGSDLFGASLVSLSSAVAIQFGYAGGLIVLSRLVARQKARRRIPLGEPPLTSA
jgi:hypothetical protein